MARLASRMDRLGTETAFEVLARAKALEAQGKDIIHLEIGEPDFPTPQHIVEAAKRALDEGFTHYAPSQGLPEVRDAIARYVTATRRNYPTDPTQVVVTPGAKPIMFYSIMALAERGDEVIYPNPGFPIYESMINFVGATPVPMRLDPTRAYHPDLDDLRSKITDRTRLVILNSPQNPTGGTISRDEMAAIADLLRDRDLYVLSDEVYRVMVYKGEHVSVTDFPGMPEKTILLDGFSKTYAMTGWRAGFGVFPRELVEPITKLVTNSVSCTAPFIQRACVAALEGPQDDVEAMVTEFRRRRDAVVAGLRRIPGIECPEPEGAFYAFPDIRGTGLSSREFETMALNEAGVALLGGHAFGEYGEGFVRLSTANSLENLERALGRLDAMVRKRVRV